MLASPLPRIIGKCLASDRIDIDTVVSKLAEDGCKVLFFSIAAILNCGAVPPVSSRRVGFLSRRIGLPEHHVTLGI